METNLPLAGVRVVELASWIMAPASAAMMAAYGADVVKVEPSGSADPSRGFTVAVGEAQVEPGFELANGGKRSIQLNLGSDAGREVMHRLLEQADVFVTNVRARSLERATLAPETLTERYPRLVVAHATGYGTRGEDRERPAFDELAYWSRGGIADTLRLEDREPVNLVGAMGDLPASVSLLAGVLMALLRREREGRGGIVDVSLYQCGLWANGWVVQQALLGSTRRRAPDRTQARSPLNNSYRSSDGRWLQFAMPQASRYWRPVCEALGLDSLADDDRFATAALIMEHSAEAIRALDDAIGSMSLDELAPRLDAKDLPWSPILSAEDIARDQQAVENGYVVERQHRSGQTIRTLSPPFHLREAHPRTVGAPAPGGDTAALLEQVGFSPDDIADLAVRGAF